MKGIALPVQLYSCRSGAHQGALARSVLLFLQKSRDTVILCQ